MVISTKLKRVFEDSHIIFYIISTATLLFAISNVRLLGINIFNSNLRCLFLCVRVGTILFITLLLLGGIKIICSIFTTKDKLIFDQKMKYAFNIIKTSAFLLVFISLISFLFFFIGTSSLHTPEAIGRYVISATQTTFDSKCQLLNHLRSRENLYGWMIFGVGNCEEMAYVSKYLLGRAGYEAYIAFFPGEDHMFTLYRINQTWYAVDPGYYDGEILSLSQRIERRIEEMGNISSIIVLTNDNNYADLTSKYLKYDFYLIQVTNGSEPIKHACIQLNHKFGGNLKWIPLNTFCYYTNETGFAEIALSGSKYNNSIAQPYDPNFQIVVNNIQTGLYIESSATGIVHVIKIDLSTLKKEDSN